MATVLASSVSGSGEGVLETGDGVSEITSCERGVKGVVGVTGCGTASGDAKRSSALKFKECG